MDAKFQKPKLRKRIRLHIPTLEEREKREDMIMMYKCVRKIEENDRNNQEATVKNCEDWRKKAIRKHFFLSRTIPETNYQVKCV